MCSGSLKPPFGTIFLRFTFGTISPGPLCSGPLRSIPFRPTPREQISASVSLDLPPRGCALTLSSSTWTLPSESALFYDTGFLSSSANVYEFPERRAEVNTAVIYEKKKKKKRSRATLRCPKARPDLLERYGPTVALHTERLLFFAPAISPAREAKTSHEEMTSLCLMEAAIRTWVRGTPDFIFTPASFSLNLSRHFYRYSFSFPVH